MNSLKENAGACEATGAAEIINNLSNSYTTSRAGQDNFGVNKFYEFTPREKFNLDVVLFEIEMEEMAEKIQLLHKKGVPAKLRFESTFSDIKSTANRIQSIPNELVFCNYNYLYPDSFFLLLEWCWLSKVWGKVVKWRFERAENKLSENIRKLSEIIQDNINLVEWAHAKQLLDDKGYQDNLEGIVLCKKQVDDYLVATGKVVRG